MSGWTEEGLRRTWRALSNQVANEAWRLVHFHQIGAAMLEVGCHFPFGREALIASFPGDKAISPSMLPEGNGFDVKLLDDPPLRVGATTVALVRKPDGEPDIFLAMALDVIRRIEVEDTEARTSLAEAFIERVREWQLFMTKGRRPLSPDAQIGLYGELCFFETLLKVLPEQTAVNCWTGPLRAAQDFHVAGGAVEVKSTVGADRFLATINSIEQLDSIRSPLFLCACRMTEGVEGLSLADKVTSLRTGFADQSAQRHFDSLLRVAGYLDEDEHLYNVPITIKEMMFYPVTPAFPRLSRGEVPAPVRSAKYVLDVDSIEIEPIDVTEALNEFGLNSHEH